MTGALAAVVAAIGVALAATAHSPAASRSSPGERSSASDLGRYFARHPVYVIPPH
jgi:hypothetical protein